MTHCANSPHAPEVIKVRGIVSSGAGESQRFTELPWVRKQLIDKLSIDAYPGTLNIIVIPEDRGKLNLVKSAKGIEITPAHMGYCAAKSFKAVMNNKVPGAVIIPLVPDYPEAQLEIISAEHVKQHLRLKDGDSVDVEIYLQ